MIWEPNNPRPTSDISDVASTIRANKVVIDNSMQTTFYWSDSVQSGGVPRISTSTPGSFRAYYGPQSEVSYPGRDGTLMFTSDTGVLYGFAAGEAIPLSSLSAIHAIHRSQDATSANAVRDVNERKIVAIGHVLVGGENVKATGVTIPFNATFAESPQVTLTMNSFGNPANSSASYHACVIDVTTTTFLLGVWHADRATDPLTARVFWRASGYTSRTQPAIS